MCTQRLNDVNSACHGTLKEYSAAMTAEFQWRVCIQIFIRIASGQFGAGVVGRKEIRTPPSK